MTELTRYVSAEVDLAGEGIIQAIQLHVGCASLKGFPSLKGSLPFGGVFWDRHFNQPPYEWLLGFT